MFELILVAVDGSPPSVAGLHAATALAADQRATLVVLHVVDERAAPITVEGMIYPEGYLDAYSRALKANGRKLLDQAAKYARECGVKVERLLVDSKLQTVAHVIIAQAKKRKVDAIVVGTHGRRGLRRMLMGSDAEQVVREATVPVLLVRGSYPNARKSTRKSTPVAHGSAHSRTRHKISTT